MYLIYIGSVNLRIDLINWTHVYWPDSNQAKFYLEFGAITATGGLRRSRRVIENPELPPGASVVLSGSWTGEFNCPPGSQPRAN